MDVKNLVTNPWVLAGLGGGGGYLAGRKYIKKNGAMYGALGGALAGYIVGRLVAPKQPAMLPAQQPQPQMQGQEYGGYGDFVEFEDDNQTVSMPGASAYHSPSQAARAQHEANAAVQPPPPGSVESVEDLSEGWNGSMGSMSGGLGDMANDAELDELIAQAGGNRGGNGRV